ncbi:hypothetical protein ACFW4K_11620 [Nocardiopsis alba]|uniref:hypothetical protein n=1 Tax=Nocardiopsis alba TaxID=53437 RepID=UPI00366B9EA9
MNDDHDGWRVLARADWPEEGETAPLPSVPGFMGSRLVPLTVHVAGLCLGRAYGRSPATPERSERTGVLLVTARGDVENGIAIARAVDGGRRASPLLFFQSIPNSVLGHITGKWGLGGPVLCTSPAGDPWAEALEICRGLIESGDADEILAITAEQGCLEGESDTARARLLAPSPESATGSGAPLRGAAPHENNPHDRRSER